MVALLRICANGPILQPFPILQSSKKDDFISTSLSTTAFCKTELEQIKLCLSGKADFDSYPELEKHKDWYAHLKTCSYTNIDTFMEMEVTKKFVCVLENAGVFKMDDEGMDGFSRFVETLW